MIRIVQRAGERTRSAWLNWTMPVWALAATAAVVLLLVRPWAPESPPHPIGETPVPWIQPSVLRGGQDLSTLRIPRGTPTIILVVSVPVGVPPGSGAVVEILTEDGQRLTRTVVPSTELQRPAAMVPLTVPEGLTPGTYHVLFWKSEASEPGSPVEETFFAVELID